MELRRAADALGRAQSSPLVSLLNNSSTVRWTSRRQLSYKSSVSRQSARCISTTPQNKAIRPLPTTSSKPPPAPESSSSEESSTYRPVPLESSSTPSDKSTPDLSSLASSLGWTDPSRLAGPPKHNTPAWASSTLSSPREQRFNGGSSASDILAALNETRAQKNLPSSSSPADFLGGPSSNSSQFDASRMLSPASAHPFDTSLSLSQDIERQTRILKPVRVPLKLGPSTGRQVHIGPAIDVGRGFKLLEMSCARNKVRREANNQRFHERPGLKRKRLRRERWRKKFMEGFKATVGRVKQLKNQGW
ncbi:hypothetical protein NA56DRAFT_651528 [Hyaloscypha hepaticicola]|uniref:Ribosomal protein S21 n=1 Tax=Hyaloscypha hepaticicola TaxID=2082293 RepID=A0A2J6PI77_9HELO|nr:hypothetical protein NA56DRAFT_651528 [Hyaloscypha hepaticicola]